MATASETISKAIQRVPPKTIANIHRIIKQTGASAWTVIAIAVTLTWLNVTQPEVSDIYKWHITLIFLLVLARRIYQDWDDHYTLDELGERIVELEQRVANYQRAIEIEMSDDEIADRINGS